MTIIYFWFHFEAKYCTSLALHNNNTSRKSSQRGILWCLTCINVSRGKPPGQACVTNFLCWEMKLKPETSSASSHRPWLISCVRGQTPAVIALRCQCTITVMTRRGTRGSATLSNDLQGAFQLVSAEQINQHFYSAIHSDAKIIEASESWCETIV